MEHICKFPEIPSTFSESKVLCFIGELNLMSLSISNFLNTSFQVEEGFNFYSTNDILIVTYSTNGLSINHKLFGLKKLSEISNDIVYAISESSLLKSNKDYADLAKHSLEKIISYTFTDIFIINNINKLNKTLELACH